MDGASQHRGDLTGNRRLGRPFHERLGHVGRVDVGQKAHLVLQVAALVAGGDDQRGLVDVGVVEGALGVAHAGCGVQVDDRGSAGDLRVGVGHSDRYHLLQTEHVSEIGWKVLQQSQFR